MEPIPKYDELPRDESGTPHAWGLFGEDDSLGRLNLITPEVATEAVGVVRRGVSFGLNLSITDFHLPLDNTRAETRHRVLRGGHDGVEDLKRRPRRLLPADLEPVGLAGAHRGRAERLLQRPFGRGRHGARAKHDRPRGEEGCRD
jgi:hypothetical protein